MTDIAVQMIMTKMETIAYHHAALNALVAATAYGLAPGQSISLHIMADEAWVEARSDGVQMKLDYDVHETPLLEQINCAVNAVRERTAK